MEMYEFYTGKLFNAYEYFGCHLSPTGGAVLRVFAPGASKISVIGDFQWQEQELNRIYNGQFWEINIPNAKEGDRYKIRVYTGDGKFIDHCDPYGFGMELRPQSCSIIRDLKGYRWNDEKWLHKRNDHKKRALNIYEMHLGSWKRKQDGSFYSYSEIADELISYLKDSGYNYVEFMPLGEHPVDNSWGYQQTGFYSPTSRYGTPDQLRELVDKLHQNNIGCILDFVPVHFALDDYALAKFDGTFLYEYPNTDVGNSEWGSHNFMHSRGEVKTYLQSCAYYWINEFHFDGLRMDAISNMIYWQGNQNRGVNNNAVEFIKYMNKGLKEKFPGIILAAEDSTSFQKVCSPVSEGGLGFDYKWDMGWMNDTIKYFNSDPCERPKLYHKLTFSMMYFYSEKFILPLSHDEVVHGKGTMLNKMYGSEQERFRQLRAFYLYMYAHPGKKLNFMGNEIAQKREWSEERQIDLDILGDGNHKSYNEYMKALCALYNSHSALWEADFDEDGFCWIDCHEEERCIYSFMRSGEKEKLVFVFNFSDKKQEVYKLPLKEKAALEKLFDTDSTGTTVEYDIEENAILSIPAYSGCCFTIK